MYVLQPGEGYHKLNTRFFGSGTPKALPPLKLSGAWEFPVSPFFSFPNSEVPLNFFGVLDLVVGIRRAFYFR